MVVSSASQMAFQAVWSRSRWLASFLSMKLSAGHSRWRERESRDSQFPPAHPEFAPSQYPCARCRCSSPRIAKEIGARSSPIVMIGTGVLFSWRTNTLRLIRFRAYVRRGRSECAVPSNRCAPGSAACFETLEFAAVQRCGGRAPDEDVSLLEACTILSDLAGRFSAARVSASRRTTRMARYAAVGDALRSRVAFASSRSLTWTLNFVASGTSHCGPRGCGPKWREAANSRRVFQRG